MREWLRRQWNKLAPQKEQKEQPFTPANIDPILLPDTQFKTSQYLYQAGLLGGGPGSNIALGDAMNINTIVKAAAKPEKPRSEQDIALMRELLAQSTIVPGQEAKTQRILELMANPPSIDQALKASENAGKGFDRVISAVTFGRFGNANRATQLLADVIALQQAEWALTAYRESVEAKKQDHAARAAYYGALAGVQEHASSASHGHYLQSALYTLEHPEMLASLVRKEEVLEELVEAARQPGGKRLSLGEIMARSGYIRDVNGAPLPYEAARAAVDAVLLQKTADRMHQIAFSIPDALPVQPKGEWTQEQARDMAQALRHLSEHLAMTTQPESKINKEPEYEMRQDRKNENPVRDVLDKSRGVRRTLSTRGHALADELVNLAEKLERHAGGTPEMLAALKEQVHETLHKLEDFRDVARQTAANGHLLALSATHSLAQAEPLKGTSLAVVAQAMHAALPKHYDEALLSFTGSIPELVEQQQKVREALVRGDLKSVLPEKKPAAAQPLVEAARDASEQPSHDKVIAAAVDHPQEHKEAASATEATLAGAATEEAAKPKEAGKAAA